MKIDNFNFTSSNFNLETKDMCVWAKGHIMDLIRKGWPKLRKTQILV